MEKRIEEMKDALDDLLSDAYYEVNQEKKMLIERHIINLRYEIAEAEKFARRHHEIH